MKGVDLIKLWLDAEFGDLPLCMPAEISKAIIDRAHEHKLRAIAHDDPFFNRSPATRISRA